MIFPLPHANGANSPSTRRHFLPVAVTVALSALVISLLTTMSPAQAATSGVVDSFDRTVASGWGSTTSGTSYAVVSGADRLSVSGGAGKMAMAAGTSTEAALADTSFTDSTITADIKRSVIPTAGNGSYAAVSVRSNGDQSYRLVTRVAANGSTDLALERTEIGTGVTTLTRVPVAGAITANQSLTFSLTVSGTSPVVLTGKAWPTANASAVTTTTFNDTSAARIQTAGTSTAWAYQSSASGATTLSWDNLTTTGTSVTGVVPATPSPTVKPSASASATPKPSATPTPTKPMPDLTPALPSQPDAVATGTTAVGSAAVGSTSYPIPSGAIFVSPAGSDTAAGTITAPLRTITKGVQKAGAGATVVIRGGEYNESVMVTADKRITIQAYPKEAVWLDGSVKVAGWKSSGSTWYVSGWTTTFDASPTNARGAADGTTPGWQWIDPAYPMASHPDQVWFNGVAQKQVGSLAAVKAGSFYVDDKADRIYVGSDPTGKEVRSSKLQLGLTVLGSNTTVRGIGIRRYAPSVPDIGAVRIFDATNVTLEHLVISNNSTLGLFAGGTGTKLKNVTSTQNGLMGISSNRAVNLSASSVLVSSNNTEHFNAAPAAGGFKITRAKGAVISGSTFTQNFGSGLWIDESSTDVTVVKSDLTKNERHGLIFELSARVKAINNVITDNGDTGLLVLDTSGVTLWNNSVRGGLLPVRIDDGKRVSTDSSDPAFGGATNPVSWITKDIVFKNNVVGAALQKTSALNWCGLVCVTDSTRAKTAEQMNAVLNGNVYYRNSPADLPTATVRWSGGAAGTRSFNSLSDFRSATGQEARGIELVGTSLISSIGTLRSGGVLSGVGVAIPSAVATSGGLTAGSQTVGAVR